MLTRGEDDEESDWPNPRAWPQWHDGKPVSIKPLLRLSPWLPLEVVAGVLIIWWLG